MKIGFYDYNKFKKELATPLLKISMNKLQKLLKIDK